MDRFGILHLLVSAAGVGLLYAFNRLSRLLGRMRKARAPLADSPAASPPPPERPEP